MSCGGVGNESPVDDNVRDLVVNLKSDIEEKAGAHFSTFEPVSFATQVVAGTNYFVKINVGDSHIHVR